jgi:hypothetical protein
METLADALPKEQERVRELIPIYESVGVAGAFAVTMMKSSLRAAEIAAASGDVVAMARALEDLRGYDA